MTLVLHEDAKRAMLLTALYIAQEQYGSLTREALERVGERLQVSQAQVYETATFYSMFYEKPVGRYLLQVCEGLSCRLADGAENLAAYIQRKLKLKPGETSADGLFTLQMVECLASCGTSPAMRVNDTLYENLTPERVDMLLDELRGG